MRKILIFLFVLIAGVSQAQVVPHDLLPPKPANAAPVVDAANILSSEEKAALTRKLVEYNNSTSNQIVVVTVTTLHGYESDQYATEIGHAWGVGGQAQKDNGVIILVSNGKEEEGRRKVFIAPGYGLEGALPAITAKSIVDNEMVPSLKDGNYYQAFDKAIDAIIKAAAGEYTAPEGYAKNNSSKNKTTGKSILQFIILVVVIIVFIASRSGRGGGGGRNGGMMSRRGWGGLAEGMIIGSLLSGGRGGGFGGGGGSDSGGGGFGSFGGGDFGGGGAGSDW
jgi:uncharacterized protein